MSVLIFSKFLDAREGLVQALTVCVAWTVPRGRGVTVSLCEHSLFPPLGLHLPEQPTFVWLQCPLSGGRADAAGDPESQPWE